MHDQIAQLVSGHGEEEFVALGVGAARRLITEASTVGVYFLCLDTQLDEMSIRSVFNCTGYIVLGRITISLLGDCQFDGSLVPDMNGKLFEVAYEAAKRRFLAKRDPWYSEEESNPVAIQGHGGRKG